MNRMRLFCFNWAKTTIKCSHNLFICKKKNEMLNGKCLRFAAVASSIKIDVVSALACTGYTHIDAYQVSVWFVIIIIVVGNVQ